MQDNATSIKKGRLVHVSVSNCFGSIVVISLRFKIDIVRLDVNQRSPGSISCKVKLNSALSPSYCC